MSVLPRVYVTRRLPQPALELLERHVRVTVWPGELPPPRAVLQKELAQADGLLALPTDVIDAALLESAPYLRVISTFASSFDHIDLATATRRNVLVTYTPDVMAESVADFTFALMLAASRRVVEADQFVRTGRWRSWGPETLIGRDLHGATLGIVGYGQVGQAVARRASGFGMRVLYHSPHASSTVIGDGPMAVSLPELLAESAIISLHCTLNDDTFQLIDRDALEQMRPDAILINTAHGQLIDTRALVETLCVRPIVAALDVTDPEPLPANHPLLALPNALVTPHVASATVATRTRMAVMVAEDLLAALRGDIPQHLANPDAWPEREISLGDSD